MLHWIGALAQEERCVSAKVEGYINFAMVRSVQGLQRSVSYSCVVALSFELVQVFNDSSRNSGGSPRLRRMGVGVDLDCDNSPHASSDIDGSGTCPPCAQ
jgi:hypothetical protein